jgi:hypothetical protein
VPLDADLDTSIKSEEGEGKKTKEGTPEDGTAAGTGSGSPPPAPKRNKKKVSWVDDANLKQIFYFELDETERGEEDACGGVGRIE